MFIVMLHPSMLMMIPIDSARRDDSIGCYIVFWSNLDLCCENPDCRLDFEAASCFLTPFLTKTFCPSYERVASAAAASMPSSSSLKKQSVHSIHERELEFGKILGSGDGCRPTVYCRRCN